MSHCMTDEQPTANIETLRFRLRERAKAFAQSEIATLTDLHEQEKPPEDLWRAFGVTGMTSIGLAPEYGGDGGDLRAMAQVGEAIAAEGGNLGLAGAWMARQLCARLHIYGYGTNEQKERYLPRLAAGLSTPCFAVSEPGAGAHPKHLKTEAVRDGDHYIVNGKKAYLTNGPISDLILLMAITGVEEGRKQYSIFLVPRETP
ncbi:MAG: acyl-CoA dehydrogenase family protein, partial [Pseudomonadota bacterium]|nr:acyl-CoA dehydrogenase family protein [Pseudomonadota bacterium]